MYLVLNMQIYRFYFTWKTDCYFFFSLCKKSGAQRIIFQQIISPMENIFNSEYVTVIRKKGDEYYSEQIATKKMLPGSSLSDKAVRTNVITRLRKDPSVIFVLEAKGGRCEESAEHQGFVLTVTLKDGKQAVGRLTVTYDGNQAYDMTFLDDTNDDDAAYCRSALEKSVQATTRILRCIDAEDFSFVDEACPGFVAKEPEDEVESMTEMEALLVENHYQVERLYTIDYASRPCLFVHENEVLMLAESHFYGHFFIEMKRLFQGVRYDAVTKAVKEETRNTLVDGFQYKDGSWAFRTQFSDDVYKSNFANLLDEAIANLREVVEKVEEHEGVGVEVFNINNEQRALFIYEVLDASLSLSKISI